MEWFFKQMLRFLTEMMEEENLIDVWREKTLNLERIKEKETFRRQLVGNFMCQTE